MKDALWLKNRILSKVRKIRFVSDKYRGYRVFRGYEFELGRDEVMEDFQPDIVVVQAGSPFLMANLFTEIKVPVALYVRGVGFDKNKEDLNINKYLTFISNSKFTAKKLKQKYSVDSTVIHPLVDRASYFCTSRDAKYVLHVGLVEEKGIEVSFEIAKRLPNVSFMFVESWPITDLEYKRFCKRAQDLGNVKILRRMHDMKKVYKTAKVLLFPSLGDEAWGRVVNEAQINSIPVLASDRGGVSESLGAGGLLMARDASIDEWVGSLSALLNDEDEYGFYSKAAYERSLLEDVSKGKLLSKFISHLEGHIKHCQDG